jgi:hypothetical protein
MNRINVDAAIGATSTAVPTSGVRGNECASTRNVVGFELGQRIFAAKHLQVALTHPGVPRAIVFGALAASLVATVGVGLGGLIRHTAGATLALKAAAHGLPITKLALYEPPFIVDDSRPRWGQTWQSDWSP